MGNKTFVRIDVSVKCTNIKSQISVELFQLDFRAQFVREFAMCGCTAPDYADEQDLLLLVVVYQSETIFASSTTDNASDSQQRGAMSEPCISLNEALPHIIPSVYSSFLIDKSAEVTVEASACDVWLKSLDEEGERGNVVLNSSIDSKASSLISCSSRVKIEFLSFLFGRVFSSPHSILLSLTDGNLSIADTIFAQVASGGGSEIELNCSIVEMSGGRLTISDCTFACLYVVTGVLMDSHELAKLSIQQVHASNCSAQRSGLVLRNCKDCQLQNIQMRGTPSGSSVIVFSSDGSGGHSNIQGIHLEFDDALISSESLVSVECQETYVEMNFLAVSNTVFGDGCAVRVTSNASTFLLKQSSFQNITRNSFGPCSASTQELRANKEPFEELCEWNGSMIDLSNCSGVMKNTTTANSLKGGLFVSGRSISAQFGLFANNIPNAAGYPSMRNNIVCSDHALLNIQSLKGGDGLKEYSSLWVLSLGCSLSGITSERTSSFFIPQLHSVKSHQQGNTLAIDLACFLLLPCCLALQVDSFNDSIHKLRYFHCMHNFLKMKL
ncbi:uncharacterized protein MONOS_271 [Monocercomonoides exilis]|uniref:uncharacterized protein n=1 Tax=Monocercomonoides exilis TaxID=2049356 RepID=UPI003559E686|nr:hypothetical protein MONOS_271 [Monocercomonoides exilis]|eukprot:MONOS_271.1-p1 / transcript=MONOS_271.1 / gene=MONOS_271 / organism=Monocercomonoides_exilis_PA203 / gene_product=unspecified product / transcript_product=unspecified product / location=Mono_scaffold00004:206309-208183(+) / protein_length=554 / sequence_SO=supercontig / SO=protein_coding / is_pseudo=false